MTQTRCLQHRRINVIGCSGSGKSTLSRQLAKQLDVPYFEMDQLYWGPNWTEPDDATWLARIATTLAGRDGWVLDGSYTRTQGVKWRQPCTVIWLDLPLWQTLWQVGRRTQRRVMARQELWPGTGNRESLGRAFSRQSILLWVWNTHRSQRQRNLALMRDPTYSHVQFIHLTSLRQARDLLQQLTTGDSNPVMAALRD
ncbi:P-loop NTPase family protein [Parachitinimonas caeni]|uniref:(D)CMP kinase n=1 Tax=Parachitinimonas caeni TaxID=3031301 RepID=A0ABT7DWF7_9NEIS|nr:(d)CMP kinase [Parachitinimonas caeni]MDK2124398.1 (d)CMP kinase [Parachitinimonas caeni]